MIYLASPYSHPNPEVQEQRYIAARDAAIEMIQAGVVCFSPILYAHRMAQELSLGTTATDWKEFNDHIISISEAAVVLCLQGWNESLGVMAEIELAQRLGIPVSYLTQGSR